MGYLNNSTITVDAVLTKKGRELLAKGQNEFQITQFALADDEIDYDLWNPAHPLGSNYYGSIIENMPLVEATTDETNIMRYKLVSLPKNTRNIPVLSVNTGPIILKKVGDFVEFTPTISNFSNGNETLGYTAILSDSRAANLIATRLPSSSGAVALPAIGDVANASSQTVVGMSFKVSATQVYSNDFNAIITIIGNETGGSVTINLTVKGDLGVFQSGPVTLQPYP